MSRLETSWLRWSDERSHSNVVWLLRSHASGCPFPPACWQHNVAALLNSSRPQGWRSVSALDDSAPFRPEKYTWQCWTCPIALPQTQFCQCTTHGCIGCSYLHCSRGFSFTPPFLWFSGRFWLRRLPSKPSGVGSGCKRGEITALHQTISPFTSMRERGKWGVGEASATKAKRKEQRGEKREEGRWHRVALFVWGHWKKSLTKWEQATSAFSHLMALIWWLLSVLSSSSAHLLPWPLFSLLYSYLTLFLYLPYSPLRSQPPSGGLETMFTAHIHLLDFLDALLLE